MNEPPGTPEVATFRQLGVLPLHKFAADPTGTVGSWPDGMFGYFVSGTSIFLVGYDSATGWTSVELMP